ncbi:MAG: RNA pseudouridine synthase, partial [Planctomycetota bacterium]
AALRGAPLLGDRLYRALVPDGAPPAPVHSLRRGRLALHARALGFEHPATGERLELESELPADLQRCLEQLRRGDGGQS